MKRPPATFLAVAVTTLLVAVPVQTRQEIPVPMDPEDRIEVVDARLAERLGIFTDRFGGFPEGRRWLQVPDSTYILEIAAVPGIAVLTHVAPARSATDGGKAAMVRRGRRHDRDLQSGPKRWPACPTAGTGLQFGVAASNSTMSVRWAGLLTCSARGAL